MGKENTKPGLKIKMVDLHKQYMRIKPEVDQAIEQVLASTAFIQGPQVKEFAASLAAYTGAKHCITCANGTDALQLALMSLGLQRGDEVIVPVFTYVATAEVIALLGLKPVFIDVDPETFNIDVGQLDKVMTNRTRAIVPVHLFGQCADMEPIMQFARTHSLHVIEDNAQALGAVYTFSDKTRKQAGTIGTIGTTSFFPSKNLGCYGDGGAMLTNDDELAEKLRIIANHGQRIKYYHDIVGVNSRLDTLQAAILLAKLKHLDRFTTSRNEVAQYYKDHLDPDKFKTPVLTGNSTHVFHQYTILVKKGNRDALQKYLSEHGVPSMIYYPVPLHLQNAYKMPGFDKGSFPVAEELSRTVISLPIHTEMEAEELEYICQTLNRFS